MSESSARAPRQGWAELPPPDPEIRVDPVRSTLMSPSSGESSASPIEILERAETGSPKSFAGHSGGHHVSQQARQRIRERTNAMVEKQRRMAKKLASRNQRSESSEWEYGAAEGGDGNHQQQQQQEEEIAQGDRKIEQSIRIGAKYVEGQLHWDENPLGKDQIHENEKNRPSPVLLSMAPPRPYSLKAAAKFRQMIVWKGANPLPIKGDLEGGGISRGQGGNENLDGKFTIGNVEKMAHQFGDGTGHQHLVVWRPPVPWSEWLKRSGSRRWASQKPTALWLDLQGIEFDHHWLFTRAEAAERELLAAYDAWAIVHQQMLAVVKEWLALRQKIGDSEENEENGEMGELDALFGQCLQRNAELDRCRAALQRAWAQSDQSRGRFQLERLEGHAEVFEEESEGGVPDQLKAFFHSPLFMLSERKEEEGQAATPTMPSELERQRRAAVSNCRYQAQIFFNELLVAASHECPLEWPNFCCRFGQIFPLRVFERPEQLRVALRERFGRGNWQEIGDIFVPLPEEEGDGQKEEEGNDRGENRRWTPQTGLQFASMVMRGSYKSSLGCGQGGGVPFMQGRLFCALRWQRDGDEGNAAGGIGEQLARRRAKRNDPSTLPPSIFPAETLLYPEETLLKDKRLLALEKRWKMGSGRRGGDQRDFMDEIGEGGIDEEGGKGGIERRERRRHQVGEMELEMRRRLGREFAIELRKFLRESGEHQRRARDLAELVREEPLPHFGAGFLAALFAQRQIDVSRRLKPIRNPKAAATQIGRSLNESARLILNIQHASGMPQRANGEVAQLFLLCTLQSQSQSTALVDGRHANWQETLVLDIPSSSTVAFGEDLCLEMEIFDREVRQMESDDREKDTRHERVEKRWLGSARMPLSAINAMAKMDGHLALQGPIFYTGYKGIPAKLPTTVRILISRDPPPFNIPTPIPINSQFGESDQNLIAECLKFESSFHQRFPMRRILSLTTDSSGKRVLASRFLRRLAPPPQIVSLFNFRAKSAVELAAQMVASIPTFHDSSTHASLPIWSTADETLRIGWASPDEQGLLLCCWLLGLQLSAVLLLGKAMPDGPNCAYVLVQFSGEGVGDDNNDGQYWLISPGDGHHFAPSDPNCPLLSVGCVLTMENVFANVQRGEHPSQLDFDLRKRAHWEPLFAEGRKDLVSVQPEFLRYESPDENALMELRTGLEREIRLKFDEARPFAIPQWNLLASRTLREMLADSWRDLFSPSEPTTPSPHATQLQDATIDDARLAHLRPAFHISALAFRLPFIGRRQIIGHCLRTLVHTNSQPMAQFALAVHLQPFFGTILSCSVAICTLLPNGNVGGGRGSR